MVKWTLRWTRRFKRRAPILVDHAAGILPRFRLLAKIAQHRIDRSLQLQVALTNRFLHVLPLTVGTQALKLFVRIENQDGPGEPAGLARAVRVHPDHIQRLTGKAE